MKKVLIISYFFPPSNFVGGKRIFEWSKLLKQSGFYPIIVTRQWTPNQKDLINNEGLLNYECEKNEAYEVHRLPSKKRLKDYCDKSILLKPFRKLITLWELIMVNFFMKSLPYSNIYDFCRDFLKNHDDVSVVIASGRPFQSFHIGHKLKKEFPNVKWCPDYRDEWSTHYHNKNLSYLSRLIWKLERSSELKWTNNADLFLSVSQLWVDRISSLIKIQGHEIINGYDNFPISKGAVIGLPLRILYAGTLYASQNVDLFITAVNGLVDQGYTDIEVSFIGIDISVGQKKRVLDLTRKYHSNYRIIDRLPQAELDSLVDRADLLFLSSFSQIKGWYPVKLFDYFQSGKAILLCPSDHDVMEEFIKITNSGYIADDEKECQKIIKICFHKKIKGVPLSFDVNKKETIVYSRAYQVEKLGSVLHKITE